jgi:lipopolysaccharide biosynthesis regulator YciM
VFRRRHPVDPTQAAAAQLRRSLHLVLAGDLAAAEEALAEAARLDSSASEVYLALANVYRARGQIGRAIQIHQNLLLRPDLPAELRREALLGLALDFRAGGFLGRATASFEELLQVDPRNLQALRELERIQVESGYWEAAIRTRRKIGSRDPQGPRVLAHLWTGLGRAHLQEGREAEARRAFKRALGQDRHCAEAYLALGDQQLREDQPRQAIAHFRRTLDLHPAIGLLAYPRLWEAHEKAGDLGGFEALLRERLDRRRDDREAALWLARVLGAAGRRGEAVTLLRRLIDRQPQWLAPYAELGRALLTEHREAEALKLLEELLLHLPAEHPQLVCRSCGTASAQLHWRCPQCGAWDSM